MKSIIILLLAIILSLAVFSCSNRKKETICREFVKDVQNLKTGISFSETTAILGQKKPDESELFEWDGKSYIRLVYYLQYPFPSDQKDADIIGYTLFFENDKLMRVSPIIFWKAFPDDVPDFL